MSHLFFIYISLVSLIFFCCRFHQVDSDDLTIAINFWWRSNMMSCMLEHMDAYYLRRILRRYWWLCSCLYILYPQIDYYEIYWLCNVIIFLVNYNSPLGWTHTKIDWQRNGTCLLKLCHLLVKFLMKCTIYLILYSFSCTGQLLLEYTAIKLKIDTWIYYFVNFWKHLERYNVNYSLFQNSSDVYVASFSVILCLPFFFLEYHSLAWKFQIGHWDQWWSVSVFLGEPK